MKLETVSKIKGTVALVCFLWAAIAAFVLTPTQSRSGMGTFTGFVVIVGIVYTIKWVRLRRRMRMLEYAGRVGQRGGY